MHFPIPIAPLEDEMQRITHWLTTLYPSRLFESVAYEGVTHRKIGGNFYWYVSADKKDRPLEMWPLHPALRIGQARDNGELTGYCMRAIAGERVHLDADEVLNFPLPNPPHDLYGESALELVVEEAGIDLQALRSNKAMFQNRLYPSAVLLKEDAEAMTAQLKQSHIASGNQHNVLALSKTESFHRWAMTNRDLEFVKLRDVTAAHREVQPPRDDDDRYPR